MNTKEFSVPKRQPKVKDLVPPQNSQIWTKTRKPSLLSSIKLGPFKFNGFKKQQNS